MASKIDSGVDNSFNLYSGSSTEGSIDIATINTQVGANSFQNNLQTNSVDEIDLSLSSEFDDSEEDLTQTYLKLMFEELSNSLNDLNNQKSELQAKYNEFLSTIPDSSKMASNMAVFGACDSSMYMASDYNIYATNLEVFNMQYIKEHPDEFEAFMGMSLDEYNQKLNDLNNEIMGIEAYNYMLRQQEKEYPYLCIMQTKEYQDYILANPNATPRAPSYEVPMVVGEYSDAMNSAYYMTYQQKLTDLEYLQEYQVYMYNYLFDTQGEEAAFLYLDAIEDSINQAKGRTEAEVFMSKITDEEGNIDVGLVEAFFLTSGKGLGDGIENFGEGLYNLFDFTSDGVKSDNQYAQMFILEAINGLQDNEKTEVLDMLDDTYQISTSIGNMIPGMVISALTTPTVGQVLMGMSAAGNSKNEALISGHNIVEAYVYGTFSGASEAVIGKLMGNIPFLNENAKFAFKEILSEGAEELVQTYVDVGLRATILGEPIDITDLSLHEEGLKSFFYGCITSGILTGGQKAINVTMNGVSYTINNMDQLYELYENCKKKLKSSDVSANPAEIATLLAEYNNLVAMTRNVEYQNWYLKKYGVGFLDEVSNINPEFEQIDSRIKKLDRQLSNLRKKGLVEKVRFDTEVDTTIYRVPVANGVDTLDPMSFNIPLNINLSGKYNVENMSLSDALGLWTLEEGADSVCKGLWNYVYSGGTDLMFVPDVYRESLKKCALDELEERINHDELRKAVQPLVAVRINTVEDFVCSLVASIGITRADWALSRYVSSGKSDKIPVSLIGALEKFSKDSLRDFCDFNKIFEVVSARFNSIQDTTMENVSEIQFDNIDVALEDIRTLIANHDTKFGVGDAVNRLFRFIDPCDEQYGNYFLISSIGDARYILSKYTVLEIEYLLRCGNFQTFSSMENWYDSVSSDDSYGVDQAALENLCWYGFDEQMYTYREVREIVNRYRSAGYVPPDFIKYTDSSEYERFVNKLMRKGFSRADASVILSSINDAGACSYASLANEIFYSFRNDIQLFEETFGYSYYLLGEKSNGLNACELLLDLYLFANDVENGGTLISGNMLINRSDIIDVYGRNLLDAEHQTYMSASKIGRGSSISVIDAFLKSKCRNWSFGYEVFDNFDKVHYVHDWMKEYLKSKVSEGYSVSLDVFYLPEYGDDIINFINLDGRASSMSTADWEEGGGHSVVVTGLSEEGVIVSSWGAKYLIPYDDLLNGGRFTFDFSKINIK